MSLPRAILAKVPLRGVPKGHVQMMCVRCWKLGPAFKNPSGKARATDADCVAALRQYQEWGWSADKLGSYCPKCAGKVH